MALFSRELRMKELREILVLDFIWTSLLSRWKNGPLRVLLVGVRFILTMKSHFSINMSI